jgi:AcrR family transcriptional regulator
MNLTRINQPMTAAPALDPSPIWSRRIPRETPAVTEEAIVEAALGLLDAKGIEAITMRAVAERLGVTTPTLYWHVGSKDGLLDRLLDRLCGEVVPVARNREWDDRLRDVAHGMRAVFAAHRDSARWAIGRFPLGPKGLAVLETVLAALAEAGLGQDEVAFAAYAFFNYVVAFCHQETIAPIADSGSDRMEALSRIRRYLKALPPAQFPQIGRYAEALTSRGLDRRFAFGLDQLLRGLKAAKSR